MNISFIIPAYNEEKSIRRCIDSIINEMMHRWLFTKEVNIENYEIIVVDNNSTDNTSEIVSKLPCRLFLCKEQGITHARALGYKHAKYNIHAYIDSDNVLPSGWLQNLKALDDLNVVAISGPHWYVNASKSLQFASRTFYRIGMVLAKLFGGSIMQGGNFVVRKEALMKLGGYPTNISFYGEDTDLAVRLSEYGKVLFIPQMRIYSSDRRLSGQGLISTTFHYSMNFIWINIFKRPYTECHTDYR